MTYRVFGYMPDGTQPLLERLSWSTDVIYGSTGQEHRRRLRSRPLYTYEYDVVASDQLAHGYQQLLADMREWQGVFKVPLWPHAVEAPESPTSGLNDAQECLGFPLAGGALEFAGAAPAGVRYVVPAALGMITESRSIQHTTNVFADTSISIDLLNHGETVAPYDRFDSGHAVFDFLSDWSAGAQESLEADRNILDYGGLWVSETRFVKRTVSLEVVLDTPEAWARYRSFLLHVEGRLRSFWCQPGTDSAPRLWRLNTDNVELLYRKGLVTSKITIKQL